MRVKSESSWQERRSALVADGEIGMAFLTFLEDWANAAEQLQEHVVIDPVDALRDELISVEDRHGRCSIHFLGQMLAVLLVHWDYDLIDSFTVIERRLIEDAILVKIANMQEKATEEATRC